MHWTKKYCSNDWRPWFAWRPVLIGRIVVWLERLERRKEYIIGYRGVETLEWRHRFPNG